MYIDSNENEVVAAVTRNGVHVDSLQIFFDGSDVDGLGTKPKIRATFQMVRKDADGSKTAVGPAKVLDITDPSEVYAFGSRLAKEGASVLDILRVLTWTTNQTELDIPQAQIDALPDVLQ